MANHRSLILRIRLNMYPNVTRRLAEHSHVAVSGRRRKPPKGHPKSSAGKQQTHPGQSAGRLPLAAADGLERAARALPRHAPGGAASAVRGGAPPLRPVSAGLRTSRGVAVATCEISIQLHDTGDCSFLAKPPKATTYGRNNVWS